MPVTNFEGFTLPTLGGVADHTYVINSHGDIYPCKGRSKGGTIICSNQGSRSYANCLAQTDLKAGIMYGLTGVCHQIANRILYPSQQYVSKAKGYRGSVFVWGVYGRGNWSELYQCQPPSNVAITPQPNDPTPFDQSIKNLYEQSHFSNLPENIHTSELYIMIKTFIGDEITDNKYEELMDLHSHLYAQMNTLISDFVEHSIRPIEYVKFINKLQRNILSECHEILGVDNFIALFGTEIEQTGGFIDEEIFLGLYE